MQRHLYKICSILISCLIIFSPNALFAQKSNKANHTVTPPSRVIVLDKSILEDLMLLDIKPIAYVGVMPHFLQSRLAGVINFDLIDNQVLHDISDLEPDLIIGNNKMPKNLTTQLEKIAPTMQLSATEKIENIKILGIMVQKEAKAKAIIKGLRQ
ncbi:hypothetical protein L3V86_02695 [Thiotrichales bacterium 19S11-10]|nr:hypothetical protein [Thiotrichales bacterium 19S11-10]